MNCCVYKSSRKADTYLYIENEDEFSEIPEALIAALGELQLVLTFELAADRKLARADAAQVIESLSSQGFYLQTPDLTNKLPLAGKKPLSHHLPKV